MMTNNTDYEIDNLPIAQRIANLVECYLQNVKQPLPVCEEETDIPMKLHRKLNTLCAFLLPSQAEPEDMHLKQINELLKDDLSRQEARAVLIKKIAEVFFNNKYNFTDWDDDNSLSKFLAYSCNMLGKYHFSLDRNLNVELFFNDELYYPYLCKKEFSATQWYLLFEVLKMHTLSFLRISELELSKLPQDLWQSFLAMLSTKSGIHLYLPLEKLMALSAEYRSELGEAIEHLNIHLTVSFNFTEGVFLKENAKDIVITLREARVTGMHKKKYSIGRNWKAELFNDLQEISKIGLELDIYEMDISGTNFNQFDLNDFYSLQNILIPLNLRTYCFETIGLDEMSIEQLEALGAIIQGLQINSLSLSYNSIFSLDCDKLEVLFKHLTNSAVNFLELNMNINFFAINDKFNAIANNVEAWDYNKDIVPLIPHLMEMQEEERKSYLQSYLNDKKCFNADLINRYTATAMEFINEFTKKWAVFIRYLKCSQLRHLEMTNSHLNSTQKKQIETIFAEKRRKQVSLEEGGLRKYIELTIFEKWRGKYSKADGKCCIEYEVKKEKFSKEIEYNEKCKEQPVLELLYNEAESIKAKMSPKL